MAVEMSSVGAAAGTRPAIFPFAPLFRGARPFVLRPSQSTASSALPVRRVTVIPGLQGEMPPRQILLDGAILPSNSWTFDAASQVVSWELRQNDTRSAGRLQFAPDLSGAQGTLTIDDNVVAVAADLPPITYACAVARNTGTYVTGVAPALQLHWDLTSPDWNGADWQQNVLQFTYQMQPQTIVGQTFYDFSVSFRDEQTGATWSPADGKFGCLIDQNSVFAMTLASGSPPLDNRLWLAGEAGKIVTVFPYQIALQLSATAIDLQGAALTVANAQYGVTLGVSGSTASPSINGYYAQGGSESNFGVHNGTLYVAGSPVMGSRLVGAKLSWQGLDAKAQQASGLPPAGTLLFDTTGERFTLTETGTGGGRIVDEAAEALIARGAVWGGM
jgi:hypothetical protein